MKLFLLGCILAAVGAPGAPVPMATVTAVLDASNDALDFRPSEPVGAEGDIDLATLSSGRPASGTGPTQRVRQEAVVREQAADSLGTSLAPPQTPRAPTKLRGSTLWRPNTSPSGPWAPATSRPVTWSPRTSRPFTWAPATSRPVTWAPRTSRPFTWAPATSRPVTWAPRTSRPFTWAPQRSTPGDWVPGGSGDSGGSDSWDWDWDSDTGSSGPLDATAFLIILGILLFALVYFVVCSFAIGL
ncbi:adhesive plaque matrix protein-like [Thrips palmi]|uniref:Adhesive plaque matrix protein-like n=1 Tax=Thrips palmi TaxID=161013 RepID=A0A6P8ZWQ5_THRPL|nr:adhesive plaque matrix protein-like [Thrips palmi]